MSSPSPACAPPVVIYDGDCGLCQMSVAWLRARWGAALEFLPYQSPAARQFGISAVELSSRLHVVEDVGTVHGGAAAVLWLLARDPRQARWWRWYQRDGTFAELCEAAYDAVARHRGAISRGLRWMAPERFGGLACGWPR